MKDVTILYEDKDIYVVVKPAGMASQPDRSLNMDLVSYLKNREASMKKTAESDFSEKKAAGSSPSEKKAADFSLSEKKAAGSNPSDRVKAGQETSDLYVIHRLDRPVGGVMVYARNKKAAANLSDQVRNNRIYKEYYAVLTGKLPASRESGPQAFSAGQKKESGMTLLENYMIQGKGKNPSRIVPKKNAQAVRASLEYQVLAIKEKDDLDADAGKLSDSLTLVKVHLITGRRHQIRLQMAGLGAGIWGDTKYNPVFSEDSKNSHEPAEDKKNSHEPTEDRKTGYEIEKDRKFGHEPAENKKSRREKLQLALFARRLDFYHPVTGKKMSFTADLPDAVTRHFPKL